MEFEQGYPRAASKPQAIQMSEFQKVEAKIETFDFRKVKELLVQEQDYQNPDQILRLIREFKRFFTLKAFYRDVNAEILSPSFEVDKVWHSLLQFPLDYVRLCDEILPRDAASRIIDHNPFGAQDGESQTERYNNTCVVYKIHFKQYPPTAFWEAISRVRVAAANLTAAINRPDTFQIFVKGRSE